MRWTARFGAAMALSVGAVASGLARAEGGEEAYRVVVNADNPLASVTQRELSDLFLKKTVRWKGGRAVVPIDRDEDDPLREAFSGSVHGRSSLAVKHYWQRQVFAGRMAPPPERASDEEVLGFVRANPGAIGYVSAGTALGPGVKTLRIEG